MPAALPSLLPETGEGAVVADEVSDVEEVVEVLEWLVVEVEV